MGSKCNSEYCMPLNNSKKLIVENVTEQQNLTFFCRDTDTYFPQASSAAGISKPG